jgi:hypothetical protein
VAGGLEGIDKSELRPRASKIRSVLATDTGPCCDDEDDADDKREVADATEAADELSGAAAELVTQWLSDMRECESRSVSVKAAASCVNTSVDAPRLDPPLSTAEPGSGVEIENKGRGPGKECVGSGEMAVQKPTPAPALLELLLRRRRKRQDEGGSRSVSLLWSCRASA